MNSSGDFTNSKELHAVYGGVIVDVVEDSLPRVQALLSGIKSGWQKAVGSAIKRAADSGKTISKKAVTQEYAISQNTYLYETRNINHFQNDSTGGVSVVVGYAGYAIPLLKFDTTVSGDGRVSAHAKRSSPKESLDHAFLANMGGHSGIYERTGNARFPVRQIYGPATPQMIYSNEAVTDAIEEKMVETYEKRIEQEILRILNGYGG